MIKLKTPISEQDIRNLKVGDEVLLSGTVVTGRDMVHKYLIDEKPDFIREDLKGSMIYHCGPVVKQDKDGSWSFVSAGPTTSSREEPYQADVVCEYQIRGVIGKGGMGQKTADGLKKCGAAYFHAVGGGGHFGAGFAQGIGAGLMGEQPKLDGPGQQARGDIPGIGILVLVQNFIAQLDHCDGGLVKRRGCVFGGTHGVNPRLIEKLQFAESC